MLYGLIFAFAMTSSSTYLMELFMGFFRKSLVVAAICSTSLASAAVINFEDLVGQNALPSNYAGLTWGSDWMHYDWAQFPYTASSGVQRVYNNSSSNTDWFKFAGDVVFNGAFFAGSGSSQFELYNDGILVHSSSIISLSSMPLFLSSGYAGLIDEVRLNVENGSFVMDDVTFGRVTTVPEPASLVLVGLGLIGVFGALRRKTA